MADEVGTVSSSPAWGLSAVLITLNHTAARSPRRSRRSFVHRADDDAGNEPFDESRARERDGDPPSDVQRGVIHAGEDADDGDGDQHSVARAFCESTADLVACQ